MPPLEKSLSVQSVAPPSGCQGAMGVGVAHLRRWQGVGEADGAVGVGETTMAVKKAGEVRLQVAPDGLVKVIWTSTT